MSLPKIRSRIKKKVKIGNTIFEINPWSVEDELRFESMKDSLGDSPSMQSIEELIQTELVLPNVTPNEKLSDYEVQRLFIELYKASKTHTLDFRFTCQHCGKKSHGEFNISEHIEYKDFEPKDFEDNDADIKFSFIQGKYQMKKGLVDPIEVSKERLKLVSSYVRTVVVGDEIYEDFKLEEIVEFIEKELPNNTFEKLIEHFVSEIQPHISMKGTFKCEQCGEVSDLYFPHLPDFKIY